MHRRLATLALTLVAVIVAACAGSSASGAPAAALPGTAWTVMSVGGGDTMPASPPTMTFGADGSVSGTTGCNTYNGTYKVDGAGITIGPLAMRLMLCDGPVGAQETVFAGALQGATGWSIGADGTLTLTGSADIVASPIGAG